MSEITTVRLSFVIATLLGLAWLGFGFWAMMIFLGILVVGFAYEWKKGALDWE